MRALAFSRRWRVMLNVAKWKWTVEVMTVDTREGDV